MLARFDGQPIYATLEVAVLAGAYILISTATAQGVDASFLFPAAWSSAERGTGSGFLIGAIVQVALVLVGAYLLRR